MVLFKKKRCEYKIVYYTVAYLRSKNSTDLQEGKDLPQEVHIIAILLLLWEHLSLKINRKIFG